MTNFENFFNELSNIDYLLVILSLFFILFSTLKGFIQSILGIFTWVGAILISIYFNQFLSEVIINQLSKWEFIAKNLPINNISKYIIAIPLIFFLSLFLLRKFRKFITSDLNKNFIGRLTDKLFGLIFGIFFSYIVFTTILISPTLIKFNWYKENFISPLKEKSTILNKIDTINQRIKPQTNNIQEMID